MNKTIRTINEKVYSYIKKGRLTKEGDKLLLAVSGGADSISLLMILHDIRERLSISLEIITVDHGIRGQASREDAEFVKILGDKLAIPVHVRKIDVPAYSKTHGLSLEEAARILRYRLIEEVGEACHANLTATGHHMEDSAETILHNLFRGSGLHGLSGISAKDERKGLIRPLLCLTKEEILLYLKEKKIEYRTDESNFSDHYTRNRIRNQLLPQIEKSVNPQAGEHIVTAGNLIGEACSLVEELAEDFLIRNHISEQLSKSGRKEKELAGQSGGREIRLPLEALKKEKALVRREIYYSLLASLSKYGFFKNIGYVHLMALDGLIEAGVSKIIELPGGLMARRDYDTIVLISVDGKKAGVGGDAAEQSINRKQMTEAWEEKNSRSIEKEKEETKSCADPAPEEDQAKSCAAPASGEILISPELADLQLSWRVFDWHGEKLPENDYTKWIDYDKIEVGLLLRTRKSGDFLALEGGGKKSLKSYMIDKKIPACERSRIPLLADGSHIIWIGDGRLSSHYKVTDQTLRILEFTVSCPKELS